MTTPCLTSAGASAMQARVRVTVIVGDNGSGKTALLREAACARARSLSDIYVHAAARITPEAVRAANWACGAVYFDDFGDSLDIRAIVAACQVFRDYPYCETPVYLTTHAPYVLDMFACESVCVIGRDDAGIHGVRMADIIRREAPQLTHGYQTGEQWASLDLPIERIRRCGALWLPAE